MVAKVSSDAENDYYGYNSIVLSLYKLLPNLVYLCQKLKEHQA